MYPRTASPAPGGIARPLLQSASGEEIETFQFNRLRNGLGRMLPGNAFYQRRLGDLARAPLSDSAAFRRLPFTTKTDLVRDQRENPPYGANLSFPLHDYVRLHQTSGTTGQPLKILDTVESWDWWAECWEAVFRAAGVGRADTVYLAFSFGPFIGFWSAYEGAKRIGALVVPGGGQTSAQRLRTILATNATVLVCTPTYALHLA